MSYPNLYPVKPHNLHIFLLTNKSKLNRCELCGRFLVTTVLKKVKMGIYYVLLSSLVFLVIGIDTLTIYIYEYIGGGRIHF
jgi:hypothetical protein